MRIICLFKEYIKSTSERKLNNALFRLPTCHLTCPQLLNDNFHSGRSLGHILSSNKPVDYSQTTVNQSSLEARNVPWSSACCKPLSWTGLPIYIWLKTYEALVFLPSPRQSKIQRPLDHDKAATDRITSTYSIVITLCHLSNRLH